MNYGSYSLMIIITAHLIIIFIFHLKNLYSKIQKKINKISLILNNLDYLNKRNEKDKSQERLIPNNFKNINNKFKERLRFKRKIKIKIKLKCFEKYIANYRKDFNNNPPIKKKAENIKNKFKDFPEINSQIIETIRFSKSDTNLKIEKMIKQAKKIMEYNDDELNDLEYKLALKFDKRKYCDYYYSLIKTKHALFFTFFNDKDYNLKIIKIDLFFFNFTLFYVTNAIFFTDDTMHKIYKNQGNLDIIGQLPQILYSSIISILFGILLEILALSGGEILELKKLRLKKDFNKIVKDLNKRIKIKLILYFILSTIFLLFFWYYISMFCAIYSNTQIHLIKDTLLSYSSSFIEPFGIYLIPGLFRIPALSNHNKNRYILYKLSKILQMILI